MKDIMITIENKLVIEKRDMNVYHHGTRSAHMISYNSSITLPLKTTESQDYLYFSIVCGPGSMEHPSVVNLPSWLNFELLSEGKLMVQHSDERTLLRIPPGLPGWQLKLTRANSGNKKKTAGVYIYEE
jgi:hypothetical protein